MFMWIGLDFDVCWTKEDPIEAKVDVGSEIHLFCNSILLYLYLCLLMYACLGLYTFSHLYFVEGDIWGFVSVAGGGFSLPQWVALSCTNTQTWPSSQSWLEYAIPPPPPLFVRQKIQYLGSEKIMVTKWPSHWNFSRIFKNVLWICEIFLLIKKLQFSRNFWIFKKFPEPSLLINW